MRVTVVKDNWADWVGIYVDSRLVLQGHAPDEREVRWVIGVDHEVVHVKMRDNSRLPPRLDDALWQSMDMGGHH